MLHPSYDVQPDVETLINTGTVELSKQVAQLADGPEGPQLVAARAAPRSEGLLNIPDSLWITPQTVADSGIGALVEDLPSWMQVTYHAAS